MANRRFNQFMYGLEAMPVQINCSFTVAAADSGGLGITGLVGPGVKAVYMHTSATPAGPVNPANGMIYIQLQDNYYKFLSMGYAVQSPVTGADINISSSSVLTVGAPYQITAVGTSTQANWAAVGLPAGVVPAVGQSFLATVTGSGTGTGTVKAIGISKVADIELIGGPSLELAPSGGVNQGSWLLVQCLSATAAGTTTQIATAPNDGSVITLSFILSNSSLTVLGE